MRQFIGPITLVISVCAATAAAVSPPVARTQANRMVEIAFTAAGDYRDAFHDVVLDVIFETPKGRMLKTPAFWDGGRTWKVRYASSGDGHASLAKRLLRTGRQRPAWNRRHRGGRNISRRQPALSVTVRCASRPTTGISCTPTARRSSGLPTPGGWDLPAAALAARVSTTGRRPQGEGFRRGADCRRALS